MIFSYKQYSLKKISQEGDRTIYTIVEHDFNHPFNPLFEFPIVLETSESNIESSLIEILKSMDDTEFDYYYGEDI